MGNLAKCEVAAQGGEAFSRGNQGPCGFVGANLGMEGRGISSPAGWGCVGFSGRLGGLVRACMLLTGMPDRAGPGEMPGEIELEFGLVSSRARRTGNARSAIVAG